MTPFRPAPLVLALALALAPCTARRAAAQEPGLATPPAVMPVRAHRERRTPQPTPAPTAVPPSPDPASLASAPLAANSYWRTPVGAGAAFSDVPGIGAYPVGFSAWLDPDGVSVPVYVASASDPVRRVLYRGDAWSNLASGAWRTSGNPPATEASILAGARTAFPFPYHTYVSLLPGSFALPESYAPIVRNADGTAPGVRAPSGIRGSGNGDSHMVVFQPDGTAFESYATAVLSDGTIVCQTYQFTDPTLAGDGLQNGVTASMIPVYAGLVRQEELDAGRIGHAMKVVVPASMLRPAATYPALTIDRGAMTEQPPYSGGVPMGGRLAIPAWIDIGGLGLATAHGRAVAEAARTYGFVVTDRGGGGVTIVTAAGASTRWSWAVEQDLRKVLAASRLAAVPASAYRTSW